MNTIDFDAPCPCCRDSGVLPGTGAAWAWCLCEAGRMRCEEGVDESPEVTYPSDGFLAVGAKAGPSGFHAAVRLA